MSVVTVVQARLGSSRLPGKVCMPLSGATVLERMVERVAAAKLVGKVVVDTTTDASDDPIVAICERRGWTCFRGHPTDLLDRHYQAALKYGAEHVVKIPSDCPLIDPSVIDRVIGYYLANVGQFDFVSNLHPATYPDGNDVEIMTMATLETTCREAKKSFEREHTTPYIWENAEKFRLANVAFEGPDYSMSHRWVLDYPEDYQFIFRVYEELYRPDSHFGLGEILALLDRKPEIATINAKYAGVNWYRNHLGELKTVGQKETRTEF